MRQAHTHAIAAALLSCGAVFAQPDTRSTDGPEPSPATSTQPADGLGVDPTSLATGELIVLGIDAIRASDPEAAAELLREATARNDAPAIAFYSLGVAYQAMGTTGSARQAFLRAASMPIDADDGPVVALAVGPDGEPVPGASIAGSAVYNAALIDLAAADARARAIAALNPEPAALSMDPAAAFRPYEQAANAAIAAYLAAADAFRDAHELDSLSGATANGDTLRNYELARLRALDLRRELESKRKAFNEQLERIISPQEAFERIAELYEDQRALEMQSTGLVGTPEPETEPIERGQRSVLRRLQDLADRLDATAELAERQRDAQAQTPSSSMDEQAMQQQMLGQVVSEFLRAAQEGVNEAGSRAFAGLRQLEAGNPDIAAEEQGLAAEALLEIMRQLGDQTQAAQQAAEQLAEQFADRAEQAEQAGEPEQPEPQPGGEDAQQDAEGDPEAGQQAEAGEPGDGETERLLEAVLEKEERDRERVNRRNRAPVPRDW